MYRATITEAIRHRAKELGVKNYDPHEYPENDRTFSHAFCDLEESVYWWPAYAQGLMDVANWNLKKLVDEGKCMRKPSALLHLYITVKDNLALEWGNDYSLYSKAGEDFLCCTNDPLFYYNMPMNRIVMIHEAGILIYRTEYESAVPHSVKYLLEAIYEHIHHIVHVLKGIISVRLQSDMFFEYRDIPVPKGQYPYGRETRRLIKCEILSQEEINARKNSKWFEDTFKNMGIKPDEFLEIFKAVGQQYNKCNILLKKSGVKGLGAQGIEIIITRLKKDFTEFYRKHFPDQSIILDERRKVVPLFKKNEEA